MARGGGFFFRFRGELCVYQSVIHVRTLAQGHSGTWGEGVGGGNKNSAAPGGPRGYFAGAATGAPQPHGAQRGARLGG